MSSFEKRLKEKPLPEKIFLPPAILPPTTLTSTYEYAPDIPWTLEVETRNIPKTKNSCTVEAACYDDKFLDILFPNFNYKFDELVIESFLRKDVLTKNLNVFVDAFYFFLSSKGFTFDKMTTVFTNVTNILFDNFAEIPERGQPGYELYISQLFDYYKNRRIYIDCTIASNITYKEENFGYVGFEANFHNSKRKNEFIMLTGSRIQQATKSIGISDKKYFETIREQERQTSVDTIKKTNAMIDLLNDFIVQYFLKQAGRTLPAILKEAKFTGEYASKAFKPSRLEFNLEKGTEIQGRTSKITEMEKGYLEDILGGGSFDYYILTEVEGYSNLRIKKVNDNTFGFKYDFLIDMIPADDFNFFITPDKKLIPKLQNVLEISLKNAGFTFQIFDDDDPAEIFKDIHVVFEDLSYGDTYIFADTFGFTEGNFYLRKQTIFNERRNESYALADIYRRYEVGKWTATNKFLEIFDNSLNLVYNQKDKFPLI